MTDETKQQMLPSSWCKETLARLGFWRGGGTPSKTISSFWENGTIPWVSPKDMKVTRIRTAEDKITESALNSSATSLIESGAVLVVTRSGILKHSLPVAVSEVDVALNQDLKSLSPHQGIDPYYLLYAFECFEWDILHHCTKSGTTVQSIEFPRLLQYRFPIAPPDEQRRIVAKIEELFTKLDTGVASLKEAKKQLKRYRQSVLKVAVEGELTKQWREQHKDELEPASVLLERILRERRAKWEADQLAKTQAQGKTPKDDGWKAKYQEPAAPDENNLPELPEGWSWSSLDQCFGVERGRFSIRPRNDPRYYNGRFPFVQIGDLPREGGFIRHFSQTLNEAGFAVSKMFSAGTVLIAIVGATIANTGILSFDGCCPDSLVAIHSQDETRSRFVEFYLRSKKLEIRKSSYASGGQPNINLAVLLPYPVPLPSRSEQEQIVAEVERRLSVADEIEASLDAELKRAERLRQSILKRAFEGKLVPQDPNDEPASVLLERIKAERALAESQSVNGKRTARRTKSSEGTDEILLANSGNEPFGS